MGVGWLGDLAEWAEEWFEGLLAGEAIGEESQSDLFLEKMGEVWVTRLFIDIWDGDFSFWVVFSSSSGISFS